MTPIAKNALAVCLALCLALLSALPVLASDVDAAQPRTLEQRINGLELSPQPAPDRESRPLLWQYYDFTGAERIAADGSLSNYEKLNAVFLDVARQLDAGGATACTFHRSVLVHALETVGFRVHNVSGMCRTKDGKTLPGTYGYPEGWTGHAWVAVEIDGVPQNIVRWNPLTDPGPNPAGPRDILLGSHLEMDDINGELLYFDTNLYVTHGMSFEQCFAVNPAHASWLQSACLVPGY